MKAEKKNITGWEASKPTMEFLEIGYDKLTPSLFKWLKNACKNAHKNKERANKDLAGHIKEEYKLPDRNKKFDEFIFSIIKNSRLSNYFRKIKVLTENRPLILNDMWVNYQKKYEFNPPHDHSGVFSFIVFMQIPYDLKKENDYFPDVVNKSFSTSRTAFLITDIHGSICNKSLEIDKSFEGKIVVFPALLKHQVYPFYTSNDYRITVSGNLEIQV